METTLEKLIKNLPTSLSEKCKNITLTENQKWQWHPATQRNALDAASWLQKKLLLAFEERAISRRVNVALTGSALYGGGDGKKDIDILVYPYDSKISRSLTSKEMEQIVQLLVKKYKWKQVVDDIDNDRSYMDRDIFIFITPKLKFRIDLFFVSA